jgi:signal transduction histidine kinase
MTAMKWMFKMLLDGDLGPLSQTQRAMISQATASNERMIELINDTMDVIKTQGQAVPYARIPISLSNLVDESLKDFTSEAAIKGMHIRYTPPSTAVMVIGDIEKLRIVIHNLLENAIKYGAADTDISITLGVDDASVLFSITDRGITIPSSEQSRMFEKFFRTTTAQSIPGVGLGLYASKHIAERHGGTLSFSSTPEAGTTFTLTLPLG